MRRSHHTFRSGSRQAAFTLIALLVVIAIIAALATILFPVFAQAREKAWQAACLSNCKQLGTAVAVYTQDHDETLPFAAISSSVLNYNLATTWAWSSSTRTGRPSGRASTGSWGRCPTQRAATPGSTAAPTTPGTTGKNQN